MREAGGPGLRFQLRQSTAPAHRRLEAVIGLEGRCGDIDRYRALLAMFWGFYAPLERSLAQIDWRGSALDFEGRTKLPWLSQDLTALGCTPRQIMALPQATLAPRVEGVADAVGVLYVLEGSTLGGQTIVPVAHKALGLTPGSGARFFSSYGTQVGRMWREYVAVLERIGAEAETAARIEQAAMSAFDSLIAWAQACLGAPEPVEGRRHVG